MLTINEQLLRKYDVSGPRYTSYPTALSFHDRLGAADYAWQVDHSNQDPLPAPLSLYVHIPFCRSLCYYCGCHKVITSNPERVAAYMAALEREIALQGALFMPDRELRQVHLGGGTPTYLPPEALLELLDKLLGTFPGRGDTPMEIGIEIDPRTTSVADLDALLAGGFNRVSFGIQDFDPAVQAAINRHQSRAATLELVQRARDSAGVSASVDLIYGLPEQTLAGFGATLDAVIGARPHRVALYNYAHMPERIRSQRLIARDRLPDRAAKLSLFAEAMARLSDAGYVHIGMDHFALPEDALSRALQSGDLQRNFQGYSTCGNCDLVGLGASSIGRVGPMYAQNAKALPDYQAAMAAGQLAINKGYVLNEEDRLRAHIIQAIMCRGRLDLNATERDFGIDFGVHFAAERVRLRPLVEDGLLEWDARALVVTPMGRLFLRNIAMIFDEYLAAASAEPLKLYSKVL